jgi:hypothetical protein
MMAQGLAATAETNWRKISITLKMASLNIPARDHSKGCTVEAQVRAAQAQAP